MNSSQNVLSVKQKNTFSRNSTFKKTDFCAQFRRFLEYSLLMYKNLDYFSECKPTKLPVFSLAAPFFSLPLSFYLHSFIPLPSCLSCPKEMYTLCVRFN